MRRSVQLTAIVLGLMGIAYAPACDTMSSLGGSYSPVSTGGDDGGAGGDSGGDDSGVSLPTNCVYTTDADFCNCLGSFTCGGITAPDAKGVNQAVYCGGCPTNQWCQPGSQGIGLGACGGTNPLNYAFQKTKVDMLVSIGENDDTTIQYGNCQNINDGRGYTIGKVGFCTGTGDFILVAACYNDLKPGNILQKYWGHRDSTGKALDGLIYYNDIYATSGNNQAATAKIDSLGNFPADVKTAAGEADGIFRGCQDSLGDSQYLAAAAQHGQERGLQGALTIGFLYDT